MIFKPNFYWIKKDDSLVTSILVWDKQYIPYQVVIFRKELGEINEILACYKLSNQLIGKLSRIEDTRTDTENELEFHISFHIREFIDSIKTVDEDLESDVDVEADEELSRIVHEVFMSDIAMKLMMEEHPKFGFYSISPNIKKLETILSGKKDDFFEKLILMKRR